MSEQETEDCYKESWLHIQRKASEALARDFPGVAAATGFDASLRLKAIEIASRECPRISEFYHYDLDRGWLNSDGVPVYLDAMTRFVPRTVLTGPLIALINAEIANSLEGH